MKTRKTLLPGILCTLLLTLTACTFVTPQATLNTHNQSEGTNTTLGNIHINNVLLVNNDEHRASLIASLTNTGSQTETLFISETTRTSPILASFSLEPQTTLSIGKDPSQPEQLVVFEKFAHPAGTNFPLYFYTEGKTGSELNVPIFDSAHERYAAYLLPLLSSPSPKP